MLFEISGADAMTTTFDFSLLNNSEFLALVLATFVEEGDENPPSLADVMAVIARCHPNGPVADKIDWSDRYGWAVLSHWQLCELLLNFWQALPPEIDARQRGNRISKPDRE